MHMAVSTSVEEKIQGDVGLPGDTFDTGGTVHG
jgi:hypothetical protein